VDLSIKLALSALLLFSATGSALAVAATNTTAVTNGINYLNAQQQADGSINGFTGINAWASLAYTAAGHDNASLRAYLLAHPPAAGASATEWERMILAITADGQNPYNFGGTNYVAGLKATHTGGQLGSTSAVNDDIFGLLALFAARAPVTDPAVTDALTFILGHQRADGGFSYSANAATGSDVDDTAAAIMALRAAQLATVPNTGIAAALADARAYMLGTQNSDGGFPYDPLTPADWGGPVSNVSTTSWALMALTSLGQANTPEGTAAQNYLKAAQQPDGSFPYTAPGAGDTFNSAYAVAALAGATWPQAVYNGPLPAAVNSSSPSPTPAGTVLGASSGVLPAVGQHSNQVPGLTALGVALASGLIAYMAPRRKDHAVH
jgi:prenyltransferase beta subunit